MLSNEYSCLVVKFVFLAFSMLGVVVISFGISFRNLKPFYSLLFNLLFFVSLKTTCLFLLLWLLDTLP